ncbi:hypothetical protein JW979_11580 [bacterium]|nr:hypothetical protein [candidate division CSSED10-310 bacterium]
MCTIGAVKNFTNRESYFFKNLDQTDQFTYHQPFIEKGSRFRYLKLSSSHNPREKGVWAGVNEAGMVILGADGNCLPNYCGTSYTSLNDSLVAYEEALAECETAQEAMEFLMRCYQSKHIGGNGDIIMTGDRNEAIAMEYSPDRWGIQYRASLPYLVRSNFFILLNSIRPMPEENTLHTSSAMRYNDALKHLSIKGTQNTLDDIMDLVKSHYQGETAMSICRHGGSQEYYTKGSLIVQLTAHSVDAFVVLNNYPCKAEFRRLTL